MKTRRFAIVLIALTLISVIFPTVASAASNDKYLASVKEISFTESGAVAKKAAELMEGKTTTEEKAMAVYSYIVKNYSYDWDLANDIIAGKVTVYTPNPEKSLQKDVGICYDIASLYAAMLRSQGIPCKMVKGYASSINGYHAWNAVYDEETGSWISMDLTYDMMTSARARTSWAGLTGTYNASKSV